MAAQETGGVRRLARSAAAKARQSGADVEVSLPQ
jgi:hypothetical protein